MKRAPVDMQLRKLGSRLARVDQEAQRKLEAQEAHYLRIYRQQRRRSLIEAVVVFVVASLFWIFVFWLDWSNWF